jgi:RNA polymerase sigma-70 factor (ECF subfamily)
MASEGPASSAFVNGLGPGPSSGQVEIASARLPAPIVTRFPAGHASEDAGLVLDARNGDEGAFTRLYHRYARLVHGLLLARVPPGDVDDLVQDVFLTAWNRLRALRDPAAFGGWIATITRHRAADFHRGAVESAELPDDLQAPDATAERAEALSVLEVIKALPEAYRETLLLRLVEGMTGPEIASRTGLTPASVRVNLHRGMKLLRDRLNARAESGSDD